MVRRMLYHFFIIIQFLSLGSAFADNTHWDWKNIDTFAITLPDGFLWGTGTSSYQVDGGHTNVWDVWAEKHKNERAEGKTPKGNIEQPAGLACDHWNRYKDDIQLMKKLGVNAYRFSVEWSAIEPQEGIFDESALDHYVAVCDELLANDIAPVITLHHYNDPIWFADLGGFEKDENIFYYVRFAYKVIEKLHAKVDRWLTFNSPTSYALKGYWAQIMPPFKKDMQMMAEVLKNVLESHVQLYQAVKNNPEIAHAQVGILHNILQLDPACWWDPRDQIGSFMGSYLSHSSLYTFFTSNVFKIYIPFKAYVYHENQHASQSLDFIGLNYYSRGIMHGFGATKPDPEGISTNNDLYTIYPEGLYRALKEISQRVASPLNIPIYITENGISPKQEEDRELFLQRYIYAMSQAISEGVDVRGYFYWSFMDNYEWGSHGKKRYGLYHVDFTTQERTLKPSAQYFIDVATAFVQPYKAQSSLQLQH